MSARHPPTHLLANQGPPFRLVAFKLPLAKSPQRARDSARALALVAELRGPISDLRWARVPAPLESPRREAALAQRRQ